MKQDTGSSDIYQEILADSEHELHRKVEAAVKTLLWLAEAVLMRLPYVKTKEEAQTRLIELCTQSLSCLRVKKSSNAPNPQPTGSAGQDYRCSDD